MEAMICRHTMSVVLAITIALIGQCDSYRVSPHFSFARRFPVIRNGFYQSAPHGDAHQPGAHSAEALKSIRSSLIPSNFRAAIKSSPFSLPCRTVNHRMTRLFDKLGDQEASDLADYAEKASSAEPAAEATHISEPISQESPAQVSADIPTNASSSLDIQGSGADGSNSTGRFSEISNASRPINLSEVFPEVAHSRNISDLLAIDRKKWNKLFYNSTVLKVRNERIEVIIPEYNAFGIIPLGLPVNARYRREYLPGTNVVVSVQSVLADNETLVLSMRFDKVLNPNARADLALVQEGQSDRVVWLEGAVSEATPSGLLVRFPNSMITGFVPQPHVPILLLEELRYRWMLDQVDRLKARGVDTTNAVGPDGSMLSNPAVLNISTMAKNLTLDQLISTNDIVRFRISSVKSMTNEIELTMLAPMKKLFDTPIDDPKAKSKKIIPMSLFTGIDESILNPTDASLREALNSLKWWRGQKFDHDYTEEKLAQQKPKREEDVSVDEVMRESQDMIAGRWRRLVDTALIESQKESKAIAVEKEERRIEEEIGVLSGMHEDFEGDFLGVGEGYIEDLNMLGTYMDRSMVPVDWKDNVTFFDELDTYVKKHDAAVAKGDYQEKVELNELASQLLKEMEAEAAAGSAQRRRGRGAASSAPDATPPPPPLSGPPAEPAGGSPAAARETGATKPPVGVSKKQIPVLNPKFKLIDESK